jgi:putative sigma-54 modulation protein
MELQITGTNTEINEATHRRIENKFGKLNKHLPDIIDIKVEVTEENTKSPQQHYLVRASVNSGDGRSSFHGEERAEDLFQAVDKVAAVMTRQLEKRKGKLHHARSSSAPRDKSEETVETRNRVVKTKRFIIEPMTQEEAIMQMEQMGHDFFLYTDSKVNEARLLYRRNDGNYGLIEPEFK